MTVYPLSVIESSKCTLTVCNMYARSIVIYMEFCSDTLLWVQFPICIGPWWQYPLLLTVSIAPANGLVRVSCKMFVRSMLKDIPFQSSIVLSNYVMSVYKCKTSLYWHDMSTFNYPMPYPNAWWPSCILTWTTFILTEMISNCNYPVLRKNPVEICSTAMFLALEGNIKWFPPYLMKWLLKQCNTQCN